ncbi:MAG: phosphoenolpyruvate synthase, partial [Saprospiraceae bacterium]|nr:phosphoenolpyruvate synthase [Saprospiraceae bacterium]
MARKTHSPASHHQKLARFKLRYAFISISIATWIMAMVLPSLLMAQTPVSNQEIQALVQNLKNDPRGPYKDIRWFCEDGSIIPPKEKCPEPGGQQRARYKDEVARLQKSNHLFFGQILATTPLEDVWDARNYNSRLKQYQMEKYLRANDDGWIMRKGQYYRGAIQIEDESAWGIDFLSHLVTQDQVIKSQYFLLRQAIKDVPHRNDDNHTLSVRALSKTLSDSYPDFMQLRIKIHGQPDATDIQSVQSFYENHRNKLTVDQRSQMETLISDMQLLYQPIDVARLREITKNLPSEASITISLNIYLDELKAASSSGQVISTAEKLAQIRNEILTVKSKKGRLALLDLSNALEDIFLRSASSWKTGTLGETMEKICFMGMAAFGTGLIEAWEWDHISPVLTSYEREEMELLALNDYLNTARSMIEWGTGMINGVYRDVINQYTAFEPLAYSFQDDKIRSSILLPLGETVSQLGDFLAKHAQLTNKVLSLSNQSTLRGLNPGIAKGELVVVDGDVP